MKPIIYYDVDENLWPNAQDRVDKNIEVQWTLSWHFTVGLLYLFLIFFSDVICSYLKHFGKTCCELII